jgi:hypothetical protein
MSNYETHIENVHGSTFAIGKKAKAVGNGGPADLRDMTEALSELFCIVSKYTGPAADEVFDLAVAARREMSAERPEKEIFRRLVEATRKMMATLGSKIIEAGALADAVAKIGDVVRHL